MANYYKKDPKTGKWVVDEEMQKAAQTNAAKKASVNVSTSKNTSSSDVDDIEWESYVAQQIPNYAARDASNIGLAARKTGTYIDQNTYKLGGSDKINNSQGLYGIKQAGVQAQGLQRDLKANPPADMTDAETKELQDYLGEVEKYVQTQEMLAKARTGDTSWQDDETLTKSQKNELGRMNKLHGVDQYYKAEQTNGESLKPPKEVFNALEYSAWEQRMNDGDPNAWGEYMERALADTGVTYQEAQDVIGAHGELDENAAAAEKRYKEWEAATSEASASLRKNEDFAEKSQYVPDAKYGQDMFYENWRMQGHINPDGSIFDTATEKEYAINALLNDWVAAGQDEKAIETLNQKADMIGADLQRYNIEAIPYMSPTQQEDFFYHMNIGDVEGAKKLLEELDYGLQKERWETESEAQQAWWDQANWWEKAGANLLSVPVNFMNEIVGGTQELASIFNKDALSKVHEYSSVYDYGRKTQNIRGNTSQDIREGADWATIPGTDMNLMDMLYQGGMSGLDSLFNAWVAGKVGMGNFGKVGKAAPAVAMGAGAYATTRREALESGKSEEDANFDALISQLIETGTEYLPFDNLGKHAIAPLKKAFYGTLAEGLGEFSADIFNVAYDTIKYRNQSEAGQYYNELLTQGYGKKDAILKTVGKYGMQVLESGLIGAMSGGMSAGTSAIGDYFGMKSQGNAIQDSGDLQGFVDVAKTLGLEGDAAKVLADLDAQLQAEKAETAAPEAEDALSEKEFEDNFSDDIAEEAEETPAQIDAQSVVDAVMKEVSGQTEGDVSAAVETAVADAIDFIAEEANENGGENGEGVIDTAMIVAENAMGDVSAQDAQKLKETIHSALSDAYNALKSKAESGIESAKQKNANKAEAEARAESQRQADAEKAAQRESEMKREAAKQAWEEIKAAGKDIGKTADEVFKMKMDRTAEIFAEMKQKAADVVESHAAAEAAKEAEQAEQTNTEEASNFEAPQEWIEAAENEAAQEAETKIDAENEASEVMEKSEQKTETKDESSEKAEDSIDAEDADTVEEAEQALQDKAQENNQQRTEETGKKPNKGKRGKVSAAKIGLVYRASMAKLDAQAQEVLSKAYARALEGQLAEKNITGDAAKTISKQLADMIGGREATPYIKNLINNNEAVRNIFMDSMAKVEDANANRGYLMGMGEFGYSPNAVTTATVEEEPGDPDEIKIEAKEGDSASDIVAKNAQVYLGEQAATMETMYNAETQDAADYAEAFVRASNYGKDGRNLDVVLKAQQDGGSLSALTVEQVKAAYTIGKQMRQNAPTAARKNSKGITVGKVDMRGINMGSLNKHQRASVYTAARLAKAVGFNIRFVESKANARGQYTTENGSWDSRTMTLTLDVHAGSNSVTDTNYAMMHTMGHELTHYIKQFADTALWNDYQSFVMNHLSTKMDNAVLDGKIAKMMQQQKGLTREGAIEEIIADASAEALKNITEADIQKIADTNPGLLKKIANYIQKWVKETKAAIAAAYSGTNIKHNAFAQEMTDVLDETSKRWNELLANAAKNSRAEAANAAIENAGIEVNENGDTAYVENPEILHSLRSFNQSDYVIERDKAAAALAKRMDISIEKAKAYIDDVTSIAAVVAKDRERLDFEAEDEYSAMKHNSEYKYTMDFSTLCKKRLLYTGTFDAIQKQMSDVALTENDYIRLRQMMAERGCEVACAFCYVESRRKNNGEIINKFLEVYKDAQKNGTDMELGAKNRRKAFKPEAGFTPKIADFNTSEGIANIMHNHRGVYDAYMYFMNARGVSKPKLIESRTDYRSEILKKFRSASAVRAMNRRGGLRLQSFSDFEVVNMLDMMQVVMDMSRVGLMSQAYTKVPAFARVFGGTGVKINLSLVTKGVDANGKLIFDDVEGMPHEEAFRIRDMYSEHVGTILVGKDDATIRAAMADPRIDFIIPYHASGWSTENQNALGIGGYTNFTAGQNETNAATGKGVKNFQPSEYWDYSKTGDENAQIYLEKCREAGRVPKFPQYQNYPGYWKMLIDFKMYDNNGVGSPQRAVRPDFNLGEARTIMDNYSGGHQNLPVARDVVMDFVKEYQQEHEFIDDDVKLSARVTDSRTLDFLNNQETVTTYKTMQLVDGKLYPPMAAVVAGSYEDASELGTWEQATEHPELIKLDKKGKPQFTLNKGKGKGSLQAAYNPYMHSSNLVLNDQFSGAYDRPNLVTVECEVPASELTSGYRAQYAKDTVGWHAWHTGTVAGALRKSKGIERQVLLSRWIKPVRIVPDSEVAAKYKELLDGTGVSVPDNVVPPSLLQELKKAGVSITESGRVPKDDGVKLSAREGAEDASDIRYQQRDLSELSDRELLVQALEGELTEAERDHLNRYKARVDELGKKQMQLEAINSKIAELKANGATIKNSDELRAAQTNAKTLRDSIARADAKLVGTESTKMFKNVIQRNRSEATFAANEKAREMERERRRIAVQDARNRTRKLTTERIEKANAKEKYKAEIQTDVKKLHTWITAPTSKGSVPQFLKKPVADFLKSIDFHSKKALDAADVLNSGDAAAAAEWLAQATARRDAAKKRYDEALKAYEAIKDTGTEEEIKKAKSRMNLAKGMYEMEARAVENGLASSANAYTAADKKFVEALEALRDAVSDLNKAQGDVEGSAKTFSGYIDLTGNYLSDFNDLVRDIKKTLDKNPASDVPFNRMNAEQLQQLSNAIKTLKSGISKMNITLANSRYESAKTASNDTITDMNSMTAKVKTNKALAALNSVFNWKNSTPIMAFGKMGRGGKAIFEGLQDGWDKMAHNSAKLIEFAKKTFSGDESKAWGRETDTITLESGETIQMTTAQKMSLYCHSKRAQSVQHLLGGGIRIGDIHGKRGSTISQTDNYVLTQKDINNIIKSLTARQIEVADALQEFMNTTCKDWGNEISRKRFGFEQMTEDNYFPIKTDANNRPSVDESKDGSSSMFRLLNMSSLKPVTPKANSAIIIDNIFDVFSNHAADMAKYNALALPILDFIKWYNYVERTDVVDANGNPTGQIKTRSTQKALEHAYGKDAKDYLRDFIKDLNAEHDGGRNDHIVNKLLNRAKAASVGANVRVWMLQITSAPRAAYAISPKYLIKAAATRGDGSKAQDAIGILKWKELGFYSTDMNNSVRDKVKRDGSKFDKVREWQMAPAGWGDALTANIIYKAAQYEMADKHPDLKPGTNAYKTMLNRRVREIVYKTQVVDSTMTRSDLMRSKGVWPLLTSFMSEPTLSVNMLNEGIQQAVMKKRGLEDADLKPGSNIGKAAAAFAASAAFGALVGAIANAFRDDDEYEKFRDKYLDAFWDELRGNFEIWDMLPLAKDVADAVKAYINEKDYAPSTLTTQALTYLVETATAVKEYREGKRTLTNVIFNGLKTLSYGSGLGAYNFVRDVSAIYNTCIANAVNLPRIQMYADKEKDASGALYRVAIEGDTEAFEFYADRAELYGITAEDLENDFVKLIGDEVVAGNLDSKQAEEMLMQYGGKTRYQAETAVSKAVYEQEYGSEYSKLEKQYVAGEIDKQHVIKAMVDHGEKFQYQAEEQILKWDYEKETGRKFSQIQTDYLRGDITRANAVKWYSKYGSVDAEDAEREVLKWDYQKVTNRPWDKLMYDYIDGKYTTDQTLNFLMKYGDKDEADAWDTIDKYNYAKVNGGDAEGYSKYVSVHEAIAADEGVQEAVNELVDKFVSRGKNKKDVLSSIRGSITSKYKPIYLAASETERKQMLPILLDAYVAAGGKRSTYNRQMTYYWFKD